ncbi:MAG: phytanoyl-CoA dioxygenase family protein [Chloroflexota bacterium]
MNIESIATKFDQHGYVLLPQVISKAELAGLQADTAHMIDTGYEGQEPASDYFYDPLPDTGEIVFHRVQYIFPKAPNNSFVKLLGHPIILEVVQHLLGDDFICGAEAFVFKTPGNGKEVPVHCDCDASDPELAPLIFNVDYYLDDATVENGCLLAAPGSHKLNLSPAEVAKQGFDFPGLVEVPVQAGDVLIHNTRVVHGSKRNTGNSLRRTLYYEFQGLNAALTQGGIRPGSPLNDTWIQERIRLVMHAIDLRKETSYGQDEEPFAYQPPAGYDIAWPQPDETVNYRPALGYNKFF